MWWSDLLWGLWNGITAWITLIIHVFGSDFPIYNCARDGSWYAFGFLLGSGAQLAPFAARGGRAKR